MSIGAIGRAALGAVEIGKRIVADAVTDAYQVVTFTNTPDDTGGWETVEGTGESGRCTLIAGATRPEERVVAERLQATTPYVIRNLPADSAVTEKDVIQVGQRRFEVLGVLRAESLRVSVTAICEERS